MRFEGKPVLRKQIIPWHDSDSVCFVLIFIMILILGVAVTGLCVASESVEFKNHAWVPIALTVMSATVLFSLIIRLVKRR